MSQASRRPGAVRRLGGLVGSAADAVVQAVDLDAALSHVDLDEVLDRVDPDHLLDRIDPNRLLDRVDPDRLLDRVDPNRLLDRVDPNRLLDRVDPDRLLDRVDPNRLLDRVDVDRLLDRVDVERLVQRAGIADIVAASTGRVAGSALDSLRRQLVALDVLFMQLLLRLTGRDPAARPAGPGRTASTGLVMPRQGAAGAPVEMSGRYAGLLLRVVALLGDVAIATGIYTLVAALLGWTVTTVVGIDPAELGGARGPVFFAGLAVWWLLYWIGTLSLQGRTGAMGVLGLRLVGVDGGPLPTSRVIVWVLALPVSAIPFGAGFALMLLGPRPRSLHDRVAGAAVVYDWGATTASTPSPLARWIEAHEPEAT